MTIALQSQKSFYPRHPGNAGVSLFPAFQSNFVLSHHTLAATSAGILLPSLRFPDCSHLPPAEMPIQTT